MKVFKFIAIVSALGAMLCFMHAHGYAFEASELDKIAPHEDEGRIEIIPSQPGLQYQLRMYEQETTEKSSLFPFVSWMIGIAFVGTFIVLVVWLHDKLDKANRRIETLEEREEALCEYMRRASEKGRW